MWIPVAVNWRLNERHYGALQGLNKSEATRELGEDQVKVWRRSFDVPPPPVTTEDPRHPRFDPKYASLNPADLPATECLKDTCDPASVCSSWPTAIRSADSSNMRRGYPTRISPT